MGLSSQQEQEKFIFSMLSGLALGRTQLPIQWISRALSPGIKQSVHVADHLLPSCVEVKNARSCTSTPPYIIIVLCLINPRDNFTFFHIYMLNDFFKQFCIFFFNFQIWNIFFGGRYIILLMGLFSMYTGFVYNDVFSKSLNIFGSYWAVNYNVSTVMSNKDLQLNPSTADYYQHPYPIGLDPVWQVVIPTDICIVSVTDITASIFRVEK
jgi:hypothetical protein